MLYISLIVLYYNSKGNLISTRGRSGEVMNKEWSELNKMMQAQIKKRESFDEGIGSLKRLRADLMKRPSGS